MLLAHAHQQRLARAVHAVRPDLLIHGHFHTRYENRLDYHLEDQLNGPLRAQCEVRGLGSDDGPVLQNALTIRPAEL